jgi:hypothetical protein
MRANNDGCRFGFPLFGAVFFALFCARHPARYGVMAPIAQSVKRTLAQAFVLIPSFFLFCANYFPKGLGVHSGKHAVPSQGT